MTSSPQRLGGLLLLRLSHGTDLHYNIRVRVHCLRSRCSYHTGMTSTNTDNHSVVCELGLHCYSNPNCLLTNACCNVLRSFLIDTWLSRCLLWHMTLTALPEAFKQCPNPKRRSPPDVVEMRSSGPWPETEINTTSGNEANAWLVKRKLIKLELLWRWFCLVSCVFFPGVQPLTQYSRTSLIRTSLIRTLANPNDSRRLALRLQTMFGTPRQVDPGHCRVSNMSSGERNGKLTGENKGKKAKRPHKNLMMVMMKHVCQFLITIQMQ